MKIIRKIIKNPKEKFPALTITWGDFDGLHLGHQKILKKVISFKDTQNGIINFDINSKSFFQKKDNIILTSNKDKINFYKKIGINYLFLLKWNQKLANLNKNDFMLILKKYNVVRIITTKETVFGYKNEGTYLDLKSHFEVILVDYFLINNKKLSTTYIKEILKQGKVEKIPLLIGQNYQIKGEVVKGNRQGKTLGFPTININYLNYFLPQEGVYAVLVEIENKKFLGTANLGYRPTFNFNNTKILEIFLHNFNKEIYGYQVKIEFLFFIRKEIKFNSQEQLIKQIQKDILYTKLIFKK